MKFLSQFQACLFELNREGRNRKSIRGTILIPIILFFFVFLTIRELIADSFLNARVSMFTLATAMIWIGVFNSITSICSVRARIKIQHIQGMSILAFVLANVVYQIKKCLIQAVLVTVMFTVAIDLDSEGIITWSAIEYGVMFFLTIFAADMLGMLISAWSGSNEQAMTVMPFILVLEMIFSNALFTLPDLLHNALSWFTLSMLSRWSIDGLGTIYRIMDMKYALTCEFPEIEFNMTSGHLMTCGAWLLGWAVVYIAVITIRLSFINRESLF